MKCPNFLQIFKRILDEKPQEEECAPGQLKIKKILHAFGLRKKKMPNY